MVKIKEVSMLKRVCFVLAVLMMHSSASACSDLNGDGVVNFADFLIFINDFVKEYSEYHNNYSLWR